MKKKIIGVILRCALVIPSICCIILLIRVQQMNNDIELLKSFIGVSSQEIYASDTANYSASVTAYNLENPYGMAVAPDLIDGSGSIDPYEGKIKVCLTFDDGPSANTDAILDILDTYGVKATFFVNAKEGYDAQYNRIVDSGHTLGMHSYSHSYATLYKDLDSFAADLYDLQMFLYDKTGVSSIYYRFPGGSSNTVCNVDMSECIDYLNAKGIVYYDWNVSAQDAVQGGLSTTEIVNNILSPIYSGAYDEYVILMHDCGDKVSTVEALPIVIEQLADMENVVIVPINEFTTPVQHVTAD